jgi:hypothetical protein
LMGNRGTIVTPVILSKMRPMVEKTRRLVDRLAKSAKIPDNLVSNSRLSSPMDFLQFKWKPLVQAFLGRPQALQH